MRFTFRVTTRAILRSTENIEGNLYTVDCEANELPRDARLLLAERLCGEACVCEGAPDASGVIEPCLDQYGAPMLLRVDGTDLRSLVRALGRDQQETEECLDRALSEERLNEA